MNVKEPLLSNAENPDDGRILRISHDKLSPETLMAIIKECVTRDGTDYGEVEVPLAQKISQVHKKIISGRALILFDTKEQICNIVSTESCIDKKVWFNI